MASYLKSSGLRRCMGHPVDSGEPGEGTQWPRLQMAGSAMQPNQYNTYGRSNKLQLPVSSLYKEFKVSPTREALFYWDSRDSRVMSADIKVWTGRELGTQEVQEIVES